MKPIKISIKPYEYECGDGCCYDRGDIIYVDGEQVGDISYGSVESALQLVLDHLGYEATLEGLDKDGEVTWIL